MITIFNNATEMEIDQVSVTGCCDSLDMSCQIIVNYSKDDLSLEQQVVHDEFMNILGINHIIKIINTGSVLSMDRMYLGTPSEMTEITEIDYSALPLEDKAKVDAFIELMNSLNETE